MLCSDTIENKKILSKYKIGELTNNQIDDIRNNIIKISLQTKTFKKEIKLAKEEFEWSKQENRITSVIF